MLRYIFVIMTLSFFSFANIPHTVIHITDPDNQTQDTTKISRDTDNASFTMTQINTEVLDIRADISKDISKDGFKAVGDLAMAQGWEDGSVEKTLAHAAMGAVVAGIGNGDALGGALGAGTAEAARPLTKGKDDATQEWVSAAIGAVASGGTGASTGLDGEKFNRQLHQREIKLIKDNAEAFAQQQGISEAEALKLLSQAALSGVDSWYASLPVDENAKAFLQDLAGDQAFVKDADNREQHLFNEIDKDLYNNHAVNANTVFQSNAQDIYSHSGYKPPNIARSIANSGQLQGESAQTQREFITNAVNGAKATKSEVLEDAAKRATIDARRNGVVSLDEIYDSSTPYAWAQDKNLKDLGTVAVVASVGNMKSNGNVVVKLANGKSVEVKASNIARDSHGNQVLIGYKPKEHKVHDTSKSLEKDSKGNVISREPRNIQDQMVLDASKRGEGEIIISSENIGDKIRFPNHDKWQYSETSSQGIKSTTHYMKDRGTSEISDIKFMNHGIKDGKTRTLGSYEKQPKEQGGITDKNLKEVLGAD